MNQIIIIIGLLIITFSSFATDIFSDNDPFRSPQKQSETEFLNESDIQPILPNIIIPEKIDVPISQQPQLCVKQFIITGHQHFSTQQLQQVIKKSLQHQSKHTPTCPQGYQIGIEALQAIQDNLTLHYIKNGFINSGAIILDQTMQNNRIKITIIEGQLTKDKIIVKNNQHVHKNYIINRLTFKKNAILDRNLLSEKLRFLQQNPLFEVINASLEPDVKAGHALLQVEVQEANRHHFYLNFNNHRSPSIGAYRGELAYFNYNLSGWGDSLYARYGLTRGLDDYNLEYTLPITAQDTTLSINVARSDSKVVTEPFNQLDVASESENYQFMLSHPVYRRIINIKQGDTFFDETRTLHLSLGLAKHDSQTFLQGEPFSFSEGIGRDGKSHVTVMQFNQNWLQRSRLHVLAIRSSFNFGLSALNSTINDGIGSDGKTAIEPDSRFTSWIGQIQYLRRLPFMLNNDNILIKLRADMQITNDDLLPTEKFILGGYNTVRGYRENQLSRDNGILTSLELRMPIARLPIPALSKKSTDGMLYLVPFIDYGRGWNENITTPTPSYIASTGLGLLWSPSSHIFTEFYWGKRLKAVTIPKDSDLQDEGIHFNIGFSFDF